MSTRFVVLAQDSRVAIMCYGLDDRGLPKPVDQTLLLQETETWPRTASTPEGPAMLLHAARSMVVTSLAAYEQLATAVLVSLQAVEAALRARLTMAGVVESSDRRMAWQRLHTLAVDHGFIVPSRDEDGKDLLDYGRRLRNSFSHPRGQVHMTYAMALPNIATSHRMVARIFPDQAPTETSWSAV